MVQAALDDIYRHLKSGDQSQAEKGKSDNEPQIQGARAVRYVFDEGHHLFDAADSAFASHLSGLECAELRRWIRGPENQRGRGRGLRERLFDLLDDSEEAERTLAQALKAATVLPASSWTTRLGEGQPDGPTEAYLFKVLSQVMAQSDDRYDAYDREASPWPTEDAILTTADTLFTALHKISVPLKDLSRLLRNQLDDESKTLESSTRTRIESLARSLERRALLMIPQWQAMLRTLAHGPQENFVDWFKVERLYGRLFDVGMHRHWIDPSLPFAQTVLENAHGAVITSATLRDHVLEEDDSASIGDWRNAEMRTGAAHLALPASRYSFASPFDYANQTRVIVVTDVARENREAVAAAFRELFLASGGGGLGLFTAITRLRNVYDQIAWDLDDANIPLYAQHVDAMDTGTLVDIFRSEQNSCLLGTDAVRDGVDVPGQSLRLIVFDRVPWPRPDIFAQGPPGAFWRPPL